MVAFRVALLIIFIILTFHDAGICVEENSHSLRAPIVCADKCNNRIEFSVTLRDKKGIHVRPLFCIKTVTHMLKQEFPGISLISLATADLRDNSILLINGDYKAEILALVDWAGVIVSVLKAEETNIPNPTFIFEIIGENEANIPYQGIQKIIEGTIERVGDDYEKEDIWGGIKNSKFPEWLIGEIDKLKYPYQNGEILSHTSDETQSSI